MCFLHCACTTNAPFHVAKLLLQKQNLAQLKREIHHYSTWGCTSFPYIFQLQHLTRTACTARPWWTSIAILSKSWIMAVLLQLSTTHWKVGVVHSWQNLGHWVRPHPSQTQPKWIRDRHDASKKVGFGVDGHPIDLMSSMIGNTLNFVGEFLAILSILCS